MASSRPFLPFYFHGEFSYISFSFFPIFKVNSRPITVSISHGELTPHHFLFTMAYSRPIIFLFFFFFFILFSRRTLAPFLSFIFMANSRPITSLLFSWRTLAPSLLFYFHGELSPHHFSFYFHGELSPHHFSFYFHGELSPHHFSFIFMANSRPITSLLFSWRTLAPSLLFYFHGELSPHPFSFIFMANSRPITLLFYFHGELPPHCYFFFFFFFLVNSRSIAHSLKPVLKQHFTSIQ